MNLRKIISAAISIIFVPVFSWAGAVITYHGRILDSNDKPVESSRVTFRVRVYSPNPGKCLLYEESRDVSMENSNGIFVIPIGDGVAARGTSDPGLSIEEVFSNNRNVTFNRTSYPLFTCNSGGHSFNPQTLDQRQLLVSFDDHSGLGEQVLPLTDIGFVPMAVNAYDAQNVGGTPANSVLRVDGGSATALTPANFTELLKVVTGTTTQYTKSGTLNGLNLPAMGNNQVLGWSGGAWTAMTPMTSYTETDPLVRSFAKTNLPACSANQYLRNDGSGNLQCTTVAAGGGGSGTVTSVAAGTGLKSDQAANAPITATGTLSVDVGTGANQVVQMGSDSKLPAVDGSKLTNVTAAALSASASISTSGNIATSGAVTAPQINTRNLYIENATMNRITVNAPLSFTDYTWVLPTTQGNNGQVLGMSTTSGQLEWKTLSPSGVSSVTADAPLVIDSSTPSAPKVTLPKATAAASGYLDKDDFATFNTKQAAGNYVTTLQGDVTSSNFAAGTVDVAVNKIKGVTVSGTPGFAGQVLRYESGNWTPGFVSMLDLRSKVTGALALSSACGANKTLTFDSLTDSLKCENITITKSQISDLGTIGALAAKSSADLTSDVNGVLPIANGGTGSSNGSITGTGALAFAAGGSNQNVTVTPSGTGFTILNGLVGIGTNTPQMNLDINGGLRVGTTAAACSATTDGTIRYNSTTNNYELCNGASTTWMVLEPQVPWARVSAASVTGVRGGRYMVDTSSNAVTVILPSAPSHGDRVSFVDVNSSFATNKLTVARGTVSQKIMGLAESMDVTTANLSFELVYDSANNDWRIK